MRRPFWQARHLQRLFSAQPWQQVLLSYAAGLPYESLAHPGIARVAFTTDALDDDIAILAQAGVEFLSDGPAQVAGPRDAKVRFICFKDPDGTVLELVEMG